MHGIDPFRAVCPPLYFRQHLLKTIFNKEHIECENAINIQHTAATHCNSVDNNTQTLQYFGVSFLKPGIVFQAAKNRNMPATRLSQPAGMKTCSEPVCG